MCRRLIVNQLPLPKMLDIAGKKPWETKHLLDTMALWKFGDYKSYTSLKLLAGVLGSNHFTYTVRFPATVFEANSDRIDAETNTVTWKFPLSKLATGPAEMRAVFKSPSGLGLVTWLLLAVGALVLLVGAITLIARLRPR